MRATQCLYRRFRISLGCVLLMLSHSPNGQTQSRETLETRVSASGDRITLAWSKKHPWDKDLSNHGPFLFIEYRSQKGVGLDCLPASQVRGRSGACLGIPGNSLRGGDRTLSFQLPPSVTAQPLGSICLHFRMPDQRVLPVRRATRRDENTARFQVSEWAQQVTQLARKTSVEKERAEIQAAVAKQSTSIVEQQRFNDTKGWPSGAACEVLEGGSVRVAQDRPVAEPKDHDDIARTVCVMRLATADALLEEGARQIAKDDKKLALAKLILSLDSGDAQPPPILGVLLDLVKEGKIREWAAIRGQQVQQFNADWNRLKPRIADYRRQFPVPHFESFSLTLKLQTLTVEAAQRISVGFLDKIENVDSKDILGFIGGSLEAYGRCVEDGKRQLSLNYRQSRELKDTLVKLKGRITDQARQECRVGIDKLVSMQTRLTQLKAELIDVEQRLAEFSVSPLNSRTQELNGAACSP